jgi:hypothetical protein
MPTRAVTELMAARRYLLNILLSMEVDANNMTVSHLLSLLEHFAENPTEYLEFIHAKD